MTSTDFVINYVSESSTMFEIVRQKLQRSIGASIDFNNTFLLHNWSWQYFFQLELVSILTKQFMSIFNKPANRVVHHAAYMY